ncbi:MAG TPA: sigma-70 family RNA polymerase sigma factor [Polyangiales bacterium]|nr:sigma-70 family RNA polymerase sigma factor [Polyangiales bacterium]
MSSDFASALRRDFALHRDFLWGLCYRMTGSAADAEDIVQDTFERALRNPPDDAERSLRPWLARVAINLSCDHLRRRKLVPYRGTWLPEPVPTETLRATGSEGGARADARYELLESTTFAFLLALEALTPSQRAVLLLRDVFDYSVRETANALELSEANVKTTLHRARAAMAKYDAQRCVPTAKLRKQTERVLRRFLLHLATDNVRAIEALLREDVVAFNDPGEFVAARKAVVGRAKVVLFHRKIAQLVDLVHARARIGAVDLNGLPALVLEYAPSRSDFAARQVFFIQLDAHGLISQLNTVLATRKLTLIRFDQLRPFNLLERLTATGVRSAMTRLQPAAQRLSRHIQVHPRSRARR